MLLGGYSPGWTRLRPTGVDCSGQQLAEATDGYFTVDSLNAIVGDGTSIAGLVRETPRLFDVWFSVFSEFL